MEVSLWFLSAYSGMGNCLGQANNPKCGDGKVDRPRTFLLNLGIFVPGTFKFIELAMLLGLEIEYNLVSYRPAETMFLTPWIREKSVRVFTSGVVLYPYAFPCTIPQKIAREADIRRSERSRPNLLVMPSCLVIKKVTNMFEIKLDLRVDDKSFGWEG